MGIKNDRCLRVDLLPGTPKFAKTENNSTENT